jgi:dethiobiotin synthetase
VNGVFVTGTDTGVGKSLVSAALLLGLRDSAVRAVGMKPVASGCELTPEGLRNADAQLLRRHSEGATAYDDVNPYAFEPAIAPHIAAAEAGVEIHIAPIAAALQRLRLAADFVVMEGVGGWMAPLSGSLMQADLVQHFKLPVVLVVGLRLGCINHALLSARAIAADGCRLIGWIGNTIDPAMQRVQKNVAALKSKIAAPCLGVLPYSSAADAQQLASALRPAVAVLR